MRKRHAFLCGIVALGTAVYFNRQKIANAGLNYLFRDMHDDEPNDQVVASAKVQAERQRANGPEYKMLSTLLGKSGPPLAFLNTPEGRRLAQEAMEEWQQMRKPDRGGNPTSPLTGNPLQLLPDCVTCGAKPNEVCKHIDLGDDEVPDYAQGPVRDEDS